MDSGSFTRAARFLKQPKSRVSRNIAALERELGTALLYRTTRQLSATEAGRALYEKVREQIYALEGAAEELRESSSSKEISGTLRVTAAEDLGSALLGPLISEIGELHPRLTVDLLLTNEVVDLVREGIDLAIRIGELEDATLMARSLGRIAFVLAASPRYLESAPAIRKLADLASHPALTFSMYEDRNRWALQSARLRRTESVPIRAQARSNNPKVLLDLALDGRGVASLPEFLCADALKSGALTRVLPEYATAATPVHFVWPASREQSPKVRAFVELGVRRLSPYFQVSA